MVDDMKYIARQEHIKRALEVAVAGHLSLRVVGGPGTGKTMFGYHFGNLLSKGGYMHMELYTVSKPDWDDGTPDFAMFENTFLSRFTQNQLGVFGTLNQSSGPILYSSNRPCPCGWYGDPLKPCYCTVDEVIRHVNMLAAENPLFDMNVETSHLSFDDVYPGNSKKVWGEATETIVARIKAATDIQRDRTGGYNGKLPWNVIEQHCAMDNASASLMRAAYRQLNMVPADYYRTLRVTRTIADLAGDTDIQAMHLAEAIQYRSRYQAKSVEQARRDQREAVKAETRARNERARALADYNRRQAAGEVPHSEEPAPKPEPAPVTTRITKRKA